MEFILLAIILWKPAYYVAMMVYHSLRPNAVGAPADVYVGKFIEWFKSLFGLIAPSSL